MKKKKKINKEKPKKSVDKRNILKIILTTCFVIGIVRVASLSFNSSNKSMISFILLPASNL